MSSVEIAGSARKVVGLRGTPKTPIPFLIETKFTEASEIETDTTTSGSDSEAEKTPMEVEPIKTSKETKRKRTRDVAGGPEGLLSIGVLAALLSEFFGVTLGHFSPVEDLGEIWGKVALIRLDLARPESGKLGKVVGLEKLAKTRIFALWRGVSLSVYTVPRVQPEFWSARIRILGLLFGLEPSALWKYLAVDEDTVPVGVKSV